MVPALAAAAPVVLGREEDLLPGALLTSLPGLAPLLAAPRAPATWWKLQGRNGSKEWRLPMWGGGGPMGKCMGALMATCTWGALPGARPGVEAAGWGPVLVVLCEVVVCPVVAPGPCWAATAAWWAARWPDWAAFTAARCAASSEGSGTGGGAGAADWGPEGGAPGVGAIVVRMGTDWSTADCTMDWMTKGRALTCLGGGLARCSMMSDMACWACDR